MTAILDEVLEHLADGEPHSLLELDKTTLGKLKWYVRLMILDFLEHYGFITLDRLHLNIQLKPDVCTFIRKIRWLEKAECQATKK